MAWTDAYEIKDKQSYTQQQVLNIFHVERADTGVTAEEILTAYVDSITGIIRVIQPLSLTHDVLECQSLSDPGDFATATFTPNAGLLSGNALSAFSAATIQFNRRRTDMKNGQKRFVAGNEANIVGNIWTTAFVDLMDDVGDAMVADWERAASPGVPVCNYVIIQRICDEVDAEGKCIRYRLPENVSEYLSYQPLTFISRDTIRSQVSRKRLI